MQQGKKMLERICGAEGINFEQSWDLDIIGKFKRQFA